MNEQDVRFSQTHEWARLEGDKTVVVGLSSHAIEQLGDVVYMELPTVGATVAKGQAFGVVESVKAAADIYAPVGGKVVAVNDAIPGDPDVLKRDAYGAGWLAKIEVEGPQEYELLMDPDAYRKFVETEAE